MMNRRRFGAAGIVCLFCLDAGLFSQEFKTQIAGVAALSSDPADGSAFSVGCDESVVIALPKDAYFIKGFEIELKAAPSAQQALDSLAYEAWKKVDPVPEKGQQGPFSGERIAQQELKSRAGYIIQVPVRRDHGLRTTPYSTLLPAVVDPRDFPFVFRLVPKQGKTGAELGDVHFQIKIRPIVSDEGALRVQLRYPDGMEHSSLNIDLDEKRISDMRFIDGHDFLVLKAGRHFIHLSSESFRDENRSFAIEPGKVLDLSIELESVMPLIAIEAPDLAVVTVDGTKINHVAKPSFSVEPGEHTIACKLGDYLLTRKFVAIRGKIYKIVLSVDLQIQETQ